MQSSCIEELHEATLVASSLWSDAHKAEALAKASAVKLSYASRTASTRRDEAGRNMSRLKHYISTSDLLNPDRVKLFVAADDVVGHAAVMSEEKAECDKVYADEVDRTAKQLHLVAAVKAKAAKGLVEVAASGTRLAIKDAEAAASDASHYAASLSIANERARQSKLLSDENAERRLCLSKIADQYVTNVANKNVRKFVTDTKAAAGAAFKSADVSCIGSEFMTTVTTLASRNPVCAINAAFNDVSAVYLAIGVFNAAASAFRLADAACNAASATRVASAEASDVSAAADYIYTTTVITHNIQQHIPIKELVGIIMDYSFF